MTPHRAAWIEEQVELIGTALPKLEAAQMLRDAMAVADADRDLSKVEQERDEAERIVRDICAAFGVHHPDAVISKANKLQGQAEAQHRGKPVNEQLTQAGKDLRLIRSLHTTGTDDHPTPAEAHRGGVDCRSMCSTRSEMTRFIACFIFLLLLPVLMLIALAIYLNSGRPIFFTHRRACPVYSIYYSGLTRRWGAFDCIKFRTMTVEREHFLMDPAKGSPWVLHRTDPRITKIGAWLRRTSLDELPQLLNIIMGEMAFIGPRPMLPHQAEKLVGWQEQRMLVKPGITGYAQVMGRNAIPWSKRIELDVSYVQHHTWKLDCWILWRTLIVWWTKEGLYGPTGMNEDFT